MPHPCRITPSADVCSEHSGPLTVTLATVHLELVRDRSKDFPVVTDPLAVETACIWHCGYRTLAPLSQMTNLSRLEIATYPGASLEPLRPLVRLERLRILHLPGVTDLEPLRSLVALKHLSLATLPSWDASGRRTEVASLAPIAALPVLEELELFGVVPSDRKVDDILSIGSLLKARVSKYPKPEMARLTARGLSSETTVVKFLPKAGS